jgi:hypothetical protein
VVRVVSGTGRPLPLRWIIALGDSDLDHWTKVVAFALSTWMNEYGTCTPSVPSVARRASVSRPTATAKIAKLERLGWLVIERSRGGHRQTHEYRVGLGVNASEEAVQEWNNRKARVSYSRGNNRKKRGQQQESQGFLERHSFRNERQGNDDAAPDGASSLPEGKCWHCKAVVALVGPDFHYCRRCARNPKRVSDLDSLRSAEGAG